MKKALVALSASVAALAALLAIPAIAFAQDPVDPGDPGDPVDPVLEAQNYNKIHERPIYITLTPEFLARIEQQNAEDAVDFPLIAATDPERNPYGNICAQRKNECAGDVRFYDGWDGLYGLRTPVLFTARTGATMSGAIWATQAGSFPKPGVVITTGSVQAPETLYWPIAANLAKAGYIVMTYDVQTQGRSDTAGTDTGGSAFYDGTGDAIDFFLSTSSDPYVPKPSCSTGTVHSAKQNRRVAAGLNAAFNPFGALIDADRLGIAGHSAGAGAVSSYAHRDPRVDAVIGWDSLGTGTGTAPSCPNALPSENRGNIQLSPETAHTFKPAMGMAADYGLVQNPYTTVPDPQGRNGAFNAFAAAGVDTMQVTTRGGTHYEWSFIPGLTAPDQLGNATLRGIDKTTWYTMAWFDKYVKGDPTADERLLTDRWCDDTRTAEIDPNGDGNLFSFYRHSRTNFTLEGGGRSIIDNLRAECYKQDSELAPDGRPVPFDHVMDVRTADEVSDPSTIDTDSDGTPDIADRCPSVQGPAENHGCPIPPDDDNDGVPNAADACPDDPGPANNDGCPVPNDSDGDGVVDAADACPDTPGSTDNEGCPLPGDRDGDGVLDANDGCPDVQGPVNNQGCPTPGDRDGDGVPNAADACPDVVGSPENEGCPEPGDSDGDGVPDAADSCPNTFGPAANEGCPEAGDRDGDDVVNARDACPDVPGPADNDGCPVPEPPVVLTGCARNTITGTNGSDTLGGSAGSDRIFGLKGNDRLIGGPGGDCLWGQRGADILIGGDGNDDLRASVGRDIIHAGRGRDRVLAGFGRDRVNVRDGFRDRVSCGPQRDFVMADFRDRVHRDCEIVKRGRPRR